MEHKKDYEFFRKGKSIITLPDIEKVRYVRFFINAYQDDFEVSKKLLTKSPRWSIITGYYAMHDITKLYLAYFNLRIRSPQIHEATIQALKEAIKDDKIRNRLTELINNAEKKYEITISYGIIEMLGKGKDKRGTTSYYSERNDGKREQREAMDFYNNVVEPYIEIIKGLIKDVA